MKTKFSLFWAFLLVCSAYLHASDAWQFVNCPGNVTDICAPTDSTLFAVSANGAILKSADGGQNWQCVFSAGSPLYAMHFPSAQVGWAVGGRSMPAVLRSVDGGRTWEDLSSGFHNDGGSSPYFFDAHFIDENTGWACGYIGYFAAVVRTNNGGQSWEYSYMPEQNPYMLHGVSFIDSLTGWTVGDYGYIFNTVDGGKTWNQQIGANTCLNSVCFIDRNLGWVASAGGGVLHTEDGGKTWSTQNSGTSDWIAEICMHNADTGLFVAGPSTARQVFLTSNGGQTWSQSVLTAPNLRCCLVLSGGRLFAAGESIHFSTDFSTTWDTWQNRVTDLMIRDVSCHSADNIWIAGVRGAIFKTSNRGASWERVDFPTSSTLNNVDFPSPTTGWVISGNDTLYRTTDGGDSWATVNTNGMPIQGLVFVSPETGWLAQAHRDTVGSTIVCTLFVRRTSNGGTSWTTVNTEQIIGEFVDMYFSSPSTGWTIIKYMTTSGGWKTVLRKTADGGSTWNDVYNGSIRAVAFTSSQNGYAIFPDGIHKSNDGGQTWDIAYDSTAVYLTNIGLTEGGAVWAVGASGAIITTALLPLHTLRPSVLPAGFHNVQDNSFNSGELLFVPNHFNVLGRRVPCHSHNAARAASGVYIVPAGGGRMKWHHLQCYYR